MIQCSVADWVTVLPASRLMCAVRVEGAVYAVPLVPGNPGRNLFVWYLFWYLIFRRVCGVIEFVLGLFVIDVL